MFFVQNNPDSFTKMIITQPICVKWVEILKWQEGSARKTLLWDGCSLDAIRVETFPPPTCFPSLSLLQLCLTPPAPPSVGTVSLMNSTLLTASVNDTIESRATFLNLLVCLPPTPLTLPYSESRLPQGPSSYFFFFSLGTLSAFIRLVWHLKTPTWHSF